MSKLIINFANEAMRKVFMDLMKDGGLEEDVNEGLADFSDEFAPEGAEVYDITFKYPSEDIINITFENVE